MSPILGLWRHNDHQNFRLISDVMINESSLMTNRFGAQLWFTCPIAKEVDSSKFTLLEYHPPRRVGRLNKSRELYGSQFPPGHNKGNRLFFREGLSLRLSVEIKEIDLVYITYDVIDYDVIIYDSFELTSPKSHKTSTCFPFGSVIV